MQIVYVMLVSVVSVRVAYLVFPNIITVLSETGKIKLLTKGDNNEVDDRGLYKPGQLWVEQDHIVGRARGFVPYVGMVTILMNDYPKLKVRKKLILIFNSIYP